MQILFFSFAISLFDTTRMQHTTSSLHFFSMNILFTILLALVVIVAVWWNIAFCCEEGILNSS